MGQIWVPIAAIANTKNDQHAFFSGQAQEEGERPEEAVVQVGSACAEHAVCFTSQWHFLCHFGA